MFAAFAAILQAVGSAVGLFGARQKGEAQVALTESANTARAKEISDAASLQMFQRAEQGRRERARVRAATGSAGIADTGGSVESILMDSLQHQNFDIGIIGKAEQQAQADRQFQAQSAANGINIPNWGQIALTTSAAAYTTYKDFGGTFGDTPDNTALSNPGPNGLNSNDPRLNETGGSEWA